MKLCSCEEEKIRTEVETVLRGFTTERENLLPILQEVQGKLGWLPREAMRQIAERMGIPAVEVYGVGTFYNQFRLNPPGKHQIKVCMGTACHMSGGNIILDSFERRLEIKEGETTADREFSLERVACVGCCSLAPVVVVDDKVEGKVTPTRVDGILLGFALEREAAGAAAGKGSKGHNSGASDNSGVSSNSEGASDGSCRSNSAGASAGADISSSCGSEASSGSGKTGSGAVAAVRAELAGVREEAAEGGGRW